MTRGWFLFGALGVLATVLAWFPVARAFAYPPFAHLQLAIAVLSLVPCLALWRGFPARVPPPTRRVFASRALTCWAASATMLLAIAPGIVFADPRGALLAIAVLVALHHGAQRLLTGDARRATWLVVSLAAIAPTIATTAFALVFG